MTTNSDIRPGELMLILGTIKHGFPDARVIRPNHTLDHDNKEIVLDPDYDALRNAGLPELKLSLFIAVISLVALILLMTACAPEPDSVNYDMGGFKGWQHIMKSETITMHAPATGPLYDQLQAVHKKWLRAYPYHNYKAGVWVTRKELRQRGYADCKAYASAEYFDLIEAGIPDDQLYIAVGKMVYSDEIHAVLIVNNEWVLDSMLPSPYRVESMRFLMTTYYKINRLGFVDTHQLPGREFP